MILSIILLALLVAITIYQAIHGFFSSLIMAVLTVCCAALALGTYEWVAIRWFMGWTTYRDYAMATSLVLTFAVPLIVLRVVFDKLIRRSSLLPSWIDRAGAGICGLVTAFLMVGILALALQQVPFNGHVMGYARNPLPVREKKDEDSPNPEAPPLREPDNELFLMPDRFAITFAGIMSDGVFSGSRSLNEDNADIVQTIGWTNAANSEVSRYAPAGSIEILQCYTAPEVYSFAPGGRRSRARGSSAPEPTGDYETVPAESGNEYLAVKVKLKDAARDYRKNHMFTLRQFKLVGPNNRGQYHAVAYVDQDNPGRPIRQRKNQYGLWPQLDLPLQPGEDDSIEVVFEVPEGFAPWYIEYKRFARAEFGEGVCTEGPPTAQYGGLFTPPAATNPAPATQAGTVGGRVRKFTSRAGESYFSGDLPVPLRNYSEGANFEVERDAIANGSLNAVLTEQESGRKTQLKRFAVPSDKRLLHLSVQHLQAKSILGKSMTFAIETVQNYSVQDDRGATYRMIGKYAMALVDGQDVIELQYFPEQQGSVGGLGAFKRIQNSHLQGEDYELVFLFLVDPGARIVGFSTGGSALRADNLEGENLVAPN